MSVTFLTNEDNALVVNISDNASTADKTFDEIVAAHDAERTVRCNFQMYVLPLQAVTSAGVVFQSVVEPNYVRVAIKADNTITYSTGTYALVSELHSKQDKAPATDEMYFEITADGIISLKPEYRGASASATATDSWSDNGKGFVGSYNEELPEEIVIPETVNGIAVTGYAAGMFCSNKRVKKLTLLPNVKTIPLSFCGQCYNLTEVNGTENVETIDNAAFSCSGIVKAEFPNLTQLVNTAQFAYCVNMISVDLGNTITELSAMCLMGCERLVYIRNTENITNVGQMALYLAKRLTAPSFLPKLTNIGTYGLLLSHVDYDWDSLTNCTFGTLSTRKSFGVADFWTGRTFTPCNTPMRSTFSQMNPLWVNNKIGDTDVTYYHGCATVSMAMMYSAFEGVDFDSPEEFVELVRATDATLVSKKPSMGGEVMKEWLDAMFPQTKYTVSEELHFNAANLQTMYDALAGGAMVLCRAMGDYTDGLDASGHVFVIRGINSDGEVRIVDPVSMAQMVEVYDAGMYTMPVQNFARGETDYFFTVTKK